MASSALAQLPTVFVSRPSQVLQLVDLNGDGDFLDIGEVMQYAVGLPNTITALAVGPDALYVLDSPTASIYRIRDLNGDGDAMDAGEVALYAQIASATSLIGLAATADGRLYSIEASSTSLYRIVDLNGDGNALGFGEAVVVASGFTSPSSIAVRPDGAVLVAQQSTTSPVLILKDRNGDGDFLDFAESVTYADGITPGTQIAAPSNLLAYLLRASDSRVLRLQDLTQDDDVLDVGEVDTYAESLSLPSVLAAAGRDELFIAATDAAGSVYRIADTNGDGDALDFGEVTLVAQGLTQPGGLAVVTATCLRGDLNGDGSVTLGDVPAFVGALLGLSAAELCRADMNQDGQVNGLDIRGFVVSVLQ